MTWAKLGLAVFQFLNWLASLIRSNRDIELGERRSDERHAQADRIVRDAVERADPDSVSDDEAFGSGGSHNDLPRAQPLGFASYADRDGKSFDPRELQPDDEGPAEDAGGDQERTRVPLMQRTTGWILLLLGALLALVLFGHFAARSEVAASWYGDELAGRRMANGQPFDPSAMTCASRTLPFGSVLLLRHRGHVAWCVVTDRGPAAWTGRQLDLSRAVFARLASLENGEIVVEVERLR